MNKQTPLKTLIIDHNDSFTYNLVELVAQIHGVRPTVWNVADADTDKIQHEGFQAILLSPGPGHPKHSSDFGNTTPIIQNSNLPILGVCLGCQGLAYVVSGATIIESDEPFHGRSSDIYHTQTGLFKGIPSPFKAGRYHSLQITEPIQSFTKTAWTKEGIVMGIAHHIRPIWGVQFHPESILSEYGKQIMTNFFTEARNYTPQKGGH